MKVLSAMALLFLLFPTLLLAEIGYIEPWGQDARINQAPATLQAEKNQSPLGLIAEKAILFHQKVLTHTTGPRSHFRPSSSSYALEAIRIHGFIKGFLMGCDRLLRENADTWIYPTKEINETLYKWDPPPPRKCRSLN